MRHLVTLMALVLFHCVLFADGVGHIDYSGLPYSPEIIAKIEQNMPAVIGQNLMKDRIPANELGANICARQYCRDITDSHSITMIVYYSDGIGKGVLKAISNTPGDNRIFGEICDMITEAPVGLILTDIDCDRINEIVAYSSVGAAGYQHYDIIKLGADGMKRLTERMGANVIVGRMFEIDSTANKCPRQIRISYDGPVKYRPDTVRTFQFDVAKQSYQLESVKALPKQER